MFTEKEKQLEEYKATVEKYSKTVRTLGIVTAICVPIQVIALIILIIVKLYR